MSTAYGNISRHLETERGKQHTTQPSSSDVEHNVHVADIKSENSEESDIEEKQNTNQSKKYRGAGQKVDKATSFIFEKGIIYFFFRGRVGVEDPKGMEDIARFYIVLRPLPSNANIRASPLHEFNDARVLLLPKKTLPSKHGSGYLAIVEKSASSLTDLKHEFSAGEYATKGFGTRHLPPATPFAEGIYLIISKRKRSHLVYKITFPGIGAVQREFGIHERGSYMVSVKNPKFSGPGNTPLKHPPRYPDSTQEKFRGLRWISLTPEFLSYENTQLLLIGEGLGVLKGANQRGSEDQVDDVDLEREMRILAIEDRVEHLEQHDPVFEELDSISQEHRYMQTTWGYNKEN